MSNHTVHGKLDTETQERDTNVDNSKREMVESELSSDDLEAIDSGVRHVYSVLGDAIPVPMVEIKEAVWYYSFDKEKSVRWVTERIEKIKAKQDKESKTALGNNGGSIDNTRKPHYRRPPASMYANTIGNTPSEKPTSLAALAKGTGRKAPSSLSLLREKNNQLSSVAKPVSTTDSANANTATKPKVSSLQSLAQKSAGQRGLSALQSLASRTARPTAPSSSTKSDEQPQSSLASLAQKANATSGRTSLAHLASRSRVNITPEATQKTETPKPVTLTKPLESTKKPVAIQPTKEPSLPLNASELLPEKDSLPKAKPTLIPPPPTGLCAPPSAAAKFLFQPTADADVQARLPCPPTLPSSIRQAFYEAMCTSANTIPLFPFDVPSPDDIVLEAQSHRSGGKLRK